jgi:hypothetical protein
MCSLLLGFVICRWQRREAIMLTINGRPIAFQEYRRRRRHWYESALSPISWAVLVAASYGIWFLR